MNTTRWITLLLILLLTVLLIGCTPADEPRVETGEPTLPANEGTTNLGNPASIHCEEQGGTLEIRTKDNGDQDGVCHFDDGSACEEWTFFRGECAPGDTYLFDTLWVLQSYNGQSPVSGTTPTLKITSDWQLTGSTGCNSFFGSVTREGDAWKMGEMGQTMMACIDGMEQETAVLALLQSVTSHTLTASSLVLHAPDGDLVYAPAQNMDLEKTPWMLTGLAQNDAIVSTWIDETITMQFADGKISGYTGCNEFFGSYTIDGQALTLSALGQTRRACDEEHSQRELDLMTALTQVAGYQIELNTLTLVDANGDLLLTLTVPVAP